MNLIFLFETILSAISYPRSLLTIWQLSNLFFVACSMASFYHNVLKYDVADTMVNSLLDSAHILRFFLIMEHVKFIKDFLRRFEIIIVKSFPIISLFFMILFFYGLIGNNSFIFLEFF